MNVHLRRSLVALSLLVLAQPAAASASSDAAWAAFKAEVAKTCTGDAKKIFGDPITLVDARGSASYGMAIVYGRQRGPAGKPDLPGLASVVCVYDKKTKKAELSGIIETNFSAH